MSKAPRKPVSSVTAPFEQHFTPSQIAARLGWSADTVRDLFADEVGVKVLSHSTSGKRVYKSLAIPESVLQRVMDRLEVKPRTTRRKSA